MWLDNQGLHSQILVAGINQGAPFRTFDANPDDTMGFRFHSPTTRDSLRINPLTGVTFKLAQANDPGGDLSAAWTRQTDGSVAAKIWGDNLTDDTRHGQMNTYAFGKTGGTGQAVVQGQIGTSTSPGSYANIAIQAGFSSTANVLANARWASGTARQVKIIDDIGDSDFVFSTFGGSGARSLNAGVTSCTFTASAISGTTTVTHGISGTKVIVATPQAAAGQYSATISNVTATQFDVTMRNVAEVAASVTVSVYWIAIGTV